MLMYHHHSLFVNLQKIKPVYVVDDTKFLNFVVVLLWIIYFIIESIEIHIDYTTYID